MDLHRVALLEPDGHVTVIVVVGGAAAATGIGCACRPTGAPIVGATIAAP